MNLVNRGASWSKGLLIFMLATASYPACAQHLAGDASPDISVVRIIGAFAVSLMVGAGLIFAYRRAPASFVRGQLLDSLKVNFNKARRIEVIEARRISVHAELCLVRCDADEFLILTGPAGSTILQSGRDAHESTTVVSAESANT